MSREFVPQMTPEMVNDGGFDGWEIERIERDLFAHPSFRAQLRAWAAAEMRGLVAEEDSPDDYTLDANKHSAIGHNGCRAETLANIEKWEKANENE